MEHEGSLLCCMNPPSVAEPAESSSTPFHTITLKSILILCSCLFPAPLSALFSSSLPTNFLYVFLITAFMYATCATHYILLDLIILVICGKKVPVMYILTV